MPDLFYDQPGRPILSSRRGTYPGDRPTPRHQKPLIDLDRLDIATEEAKALQAENDFVGDLEAEAEEHKNEARVDEAEHRLRGQGYKVTRPSPQNKRAESTLKEAGVKFKAPQESSGLELAQSQLLELVGVEHVGGYVKTVGGKKVKVGAYVRRGDWSAALKIASKGGTMQATKESLESTSNLKLRDHFRGDYVYSSSDKYWESAVLEHADGTASVSTRYGRRGKGPAGQQKVVHYDSVGAAKAAHLKATHNKVKSGYADDQFEQESRNGNLVHHFREADEKHPVETEKPEVPTEKPATPTEKPEAPTEKPEPLAPVAPQKKSTGGDKAPAPETPETSSGASVGAWKHPVSGTEVEIPEGGAIRRHKRVKTSFITTDKDGKPVSKISANGKVTKAPENTIVENYDIEQESGEAPKADTPESAPKTIPQIAGLKYVDPDDFSMDVDEFNATFEKAEKNRAEYRKQGPAQEAVASLVEAYANADITKMDEVRAKVGSGQYDEGIAAIKEMAVPNPRTLYRAGEPKGQIVSYTESKEHAESFGGEVKSFPPGSVKATFIAGISPSPHEMEWLEVREGKNDAVPEAGTGGVEGPGEAPQAEAKQEVSPDLPKPEVFPKTFYHVTRKESAAKIKESGFKDDPTGLGQIFGPGIYLSTSKEGNAKYADWVDGETEQLEVTTTVDPARVLKIKGGDEDGLYHSPWDLVGMNPVLKDKYGDVGPKIFEKLREDYDALHLEIPVSEKSPAGDQFVVFDTKKVLFAPPLESKPLTDLKPDEAVVITVKEEPEVKSKETPKGSKQATPMTFNEASLEDVPKYIENDEYHFQQKVDGIRGQLVIEPGKKPWFRSKSGGQLVSGSANKITGPLLEKLGTSADYDGPSYTIDGELLDGKWYVFDMAIDGQEKVPWETRMEVAENWVNEMHKAGLKQIQPLPVARTPKEKAALWDAVSKNGGEGVMMKLKDSPYDFGKRVNHTLKAKITATADVVVMARNVGQSTGQKGGQKDNAEIGVYIDGKLTKVGNVSTLGKEKALGAKIEVGDVIEVEYIWAHPKSHNISQPRIKKKRPDKDPSEATTQQLRYANKSVVEQDVLDAEKAAGDLFPEWDGNPVESIEELKSLSGSEQKALEGYAANDNYAFINSLLRNKPEIADSEPDVKRIRSALKKAKTTEPMTLFRGFKSSHTFEVGDVYSNRGFSSTSIAENSAKQFAGTGDDSTLFRIHAPAGTNVVDLDNSTNSYGEGEYLLPDDLPMSIVSVEKDDAGRTVVSAVVENLPEAQRKAYVAYIAQGLSPTQALIKAKSGD